MVISGGSVKPTAPRQAGDQSKSRRPYLVVSSDSWNVILEYPRITVCPLTGAENILRRYDTDVFLRKRDTGLPKNSVVRCVEIYTIFRDLLIERAGSVSGRVMKEVDQALCFYFALNKGVDA